MRALVVAVACVAAVSVSSSMTLAGVGDEASSVGKVAERVAAPLRTVTVLATGDILTDAPVRSAASAAGAVTGRRFDFDGILAPVAPVVAAADLSICHMEIPVGRPGQLAGRYGESPFGGILLVAPYELAGDLHEVGFDRCSTASNHSWDLGAPGVASTLDAFDELGISHVGTARTPDEAAARHVPITVNGVRIAHLSFTVFSNTGPSPEPWRMDLVSSPEPVIAAVDAARAAGAEVVIVSIHTFKERLAAPIPSDRAFTEAVVAGSEVDLVVQHGPHVVQPVERITGPSGDTWVFWSLGNFLSGMGEPGDARYGPASLDGLLAWARFTERADRPGRFTVEPVPVVLCTELGTRVLHAGVPAATDLSLPPRIRDQAAACVDRTRALVPWAQ